VEEIKRGNYGQRVRIRERDELHQLVENLNVMADSLERRHGRHAKENAKENTKESVKASKDK
jgi:signal transduction histidine kinase